MWHGSPCREELPWFLHCALTYAVLATEERSRRTAAAGSFSSTSAKSSSVRPVKRRIQSLLRSKLRHLCSYHSDHLGRILPDLGFTPQKPEQLARKSVT